MQALKISTTVELQVPYPKKSAPVSAQLPGLNVNSSHHRFDSAWSQQTPSLAVCSNPFQVTKALPGLHLKIAIIRAPLDSLQRLTECSLGALEKRPLPMSTAMTFAFGPRPSTRRLASLASPQMKCCLWKRANSCRGR